MGPILLTILFSIFVPVVVFSARPMLFRRAKIADVVFVISVSPSKNREENQKQAMEIFGGFVNHHRLPLGSNNIRLALAVNLIGRRVSIVVPLHKGTSRSAFSGNIDMPTSTGQQQSGIINFGPIDDVLNEDVFNGHRNGSGDRAEAPNVIILYIDDQKWPPSEDIASKPDIVIAPAKDDPANVGKIFVRKRGVAKNWTQSVDSTGQAARLLVVSLSETLGQCLYKVEEKQCYFKRGMIDEKGSSPAYQCPCIFDADVRLIRWKPSIDKESCPKSAGKIPCDYEGGKGCDYIKPRSGHKFPMWLFWIIFVPLGIPILVVAWIIPPLLIAGCMFPMLIRELGQAAVSATLERVLINILGGQGAEAGEEEEEEEEEEWEDVEEEEEDEEEEEEEEEEEKDKKKKKGKKGEKGKKGKKDKKGKKGRKGKRGKMKKVGKKMKKLKVKKLKVKKGRKFIGKTKMAKLKMTPGTKNTVANAAKRFKGKGKMMKMGKKPMGKTMATILLRVLKVVKYFKFKGGK